MVSDRSALGDGRADKAQCIVRSHQGTTTGTERSLVLGGRREEKARSERVAVEHFKPVRSDDMVFQYSVLRGLVLGPGIFTEYAEDVSDVFA